MNNLEKKVINFKSILIVDDEEVIRKICSIALKRMGYHVLLAEDGVKALKLLSKIDCDIALLDLKMPLMNGLELLHILRRDYPHIPVIIMTAYATIENAIQAMKEGAYDFILKPFKADQLRMVVERCIKSIELNEEVKELKLANQRLKEVQEMKDKFIAITSHELRTPVSHIKGYLTIIEDASYTEVTEEEKKEYMKIIKSAVTDLENIVHNMFDVLKLEYGHSQLQIETISLEDLIKQAINEFSLILKNRNLNLIYSNISQPKEIFADRLKMKQVISELMQNAIKYTPDEGTIEVKTEEYRDYCSIKVVDTGVGIVESKQSKIFEKFYEIQNSDYHSSSKMDFMGGGIGLGLAIAKDIVEAHHGRIIVESIPNEGSTFNVLLPLNYKYKNRDYD